MNQFLFRKECNELRQFPHIIEFALKKIATIQFHSLKKETSKLLRLYYIIDGKFEWIIDQQQYMLYPGDLAVVVPGQVFGGEKDFLDVGAVTWLHIQLEQLEPAGKMVMG